MVASPNAAVCVLYFTPCFQGDPLIIHSRRTPRHPSLISPASDSHEVSHDPFMTSLLRIVGQTSILPQDLIAGLKPQTLDQHALDKVSSYKPWLSLTP